METKYQPGFLAFKEIAPMVRLYECLQKESPQLIPSVWIVDGNGMMHERGIGLASHFGVLIDEPTIGAAKTPPSNIFSFVKAKDDLLSDKEHFVYNGANVVGASILGNGTGTKPIYVSIGHRVSLETAIRVVRMCCKHRIPEPTRQADILSREMLRRCGL